ncbi:MULTISPECIES: pentapeptide repeat-containing protein [unclassified Gilliamella]|uniref:pentapeptide repeat-containing protein n=1 Tax=unclassified Gilliamella TaxID=2685620 RepID=UPI00226ACF47|nr:MULTISPECIES: pentapeptide repeat-containing protein [unclassified Gilliamella]
MNIREILEQHKIWIDSLGRKGIKANLRSANLDSAYLGHANLRGANLDCAYLVHADLRGADLSGAYLIDAYLRGADLRGADLSGAYLIDANLDSAYLGHANLRGAYLGHANLRGADLRGADLRDANLRGANLDSADLRGADLRDADLPKSIFIILDETYFISITNGDCVRVEDECHPANNWRKFSKKEIAQMDGKKALQFYPRLLDIIDIYCGKGERPDWLKEE